jgi:uncharacterized protein (TIGR03437 family)
MNRKWLIYVSLMITFSFVLSAQPTIRASSGVVNASSNLADIARGSWFVIYGTGMGPATLAVASGAPYPTELSGTKVNFTPAAGGSAVDARIWYTSANQLAGLLPSTVTAGDYDVRVTYNNQPSAPSRVKVVDRNFGFATQAQNGNGPAQATYGGFDLNRFTTGQIGQWATRPAHIGDVVVLWGTGIGPDTSSDVNGGTSGDQTAAAGAKVIVDGIEVTPAYAGRSNGAPGLDQVNFSVPSGVNPGCFVSLQVRVGSRLSNLGSIAVAPAGQGTCSNPGLTTAQLQKLDQGGTVTFGSLDLVKSTSKITVPGIGSLDTTSETASGSFGKYTIDTVGSSPFALTQIGACYVFRRTGDATEVALGKAPISLDAGAQLTLNGPNANNIAVPRETSTDPITNTTLIAYSKSLYSSGISIPGFPGTGGTGSPTIAEGTYTMAGTGGPDVGAFSASIAVPGSFTWTNQATLPDSIPRNTPLTITWTGGGTGLVNVSGYGAARIGGTETDPLLDATVFTCIYQAPANSGTVPTSVLQQLPQVGSDPTSGSFGSLSVLALPDPSKAGTFTAPLTAGGNLDVGFFGYAIGGLKTVGWQ